MQTDVYFLFGAVIASDIQSVVYFSGASPVVRVNVRRCVAKAQFRGALSPFNLF